MGFGTLGVFALYGLPPPFPQADAGGWEKQGQCEEVKGGPSRWLLLPWWCGEMRVCTGGREAGISSSMAAAVSCVEWTCTIRVDLCVPW